MPNRCSHCGVAKMKIDVLPYFAGAIVEEIKGRDWQCPKCFGGFCSNCFTIDLEGDGHTLFCPRCETKLAFLDLKPYRFSELN